MKKIFHSNGKLLLTGEYVVLDGAAALAIPTKYGQTLEISTYEKEGIHWKSFDENGNVWFEDLFNKNFKSKNRGTVSKTLSKILTEARHLNPDFFAGDIRVEVTATLDFPRNWGLGTSSTLINNISKWANVDAFALQANSFGGSGYDIAAAQCDGPIFYKLNNEKPKYHEVNLPWNFKDSLFFVYLNRKQNSQVAIAEYRKQKASKNTIELISEISNKLLSCTLLREFEKIIETHEEIISELLERPSIKNEIFPDYPHAIKSLGAWGGDFIVATGSEREMAYFSKKGFETIIPFTEMLKEQNK